MKMGVDVEMGGEGFATFLLLYTLQSFELAMQDFHPRSH